MVAINSSGCPFIGSLFKGGVILIFRILIFMNKREVIPNRSTLKLYHKILNKIATTTRLKAE